MRVIAKACPVLAGDSGVPMAAGEEGHEERKCRGTREVEAGCRPCERPGLGGNALPLVMKMVKTVKMVIVISWDS